MKKIKVAIIGLGRIGFELDAKIAKKYILSYSRAFRLHGGFNLVAGFDIDKVKQNNFNKIYKIPAYHYRDLKRRLKDIDVIIISTPVNSHFRVFKDVISACHPRMIILEKPLALNLKQAKEIVRITKRKNIPLYVNYFRRIDPGIKALKQHIKKRKWGGLKHVNIYYGRGLLNDGSHFIDLILCLLGKPKAIRILNRQDRDNPDFIFFYNTISVFFKSSAGLEFYLKEMDFVFKKARVNYSAFSQTRLLLPRKKPFGAKELLPARGKNLHLDMNRYMLTVARHVYNVLSGKNGLVSTGQTALETLKVCFNIKKMRQ